MKPFWLIVLLCILSSVVDAGRPSFVVLSTADSVTVKLTSGTPVLADIRYRIRHWPDGTELAKGEVSVDAVKADASGLLAFRIGGLKPRLWSPEDPQLYEITLETDAGRSLGTVRFGFRSFDIRDRKFHLNGRPMHLRAWHINPPGRDLPDEAGRDPAFIRGYLRLVKSAHANLIRTDTHAWLDICDELGIMAFQGGYGPILGSPNASPPALEQSRKVYRDTILDLASHPSVVIYVLTNEIDYGKQPESRAFLSQVREDLRLVDPTRPVIGDAGFGRGQPGEIYDIHRYAGYYYSNLCDWYDLSRYADEARAAGQPLTISECVGAYTSDAGTFLTMSKQLATMLRWTGPVEDQRTAALEYQAELVKQIVEITRRLRSDKVDVTSVMPFTYLVGWASARKPEDLILKPAFHAFKAAFQPVLISPECWRRDIYAGSDLRMRLCVVNDDDAGRDLDPSRARVDILAADGRIVASGQAAFAAVGYYSNAWQDLAIPIPANVPKGDYRVTCRLLVGDREVSTNEFSITVAPRSWARTAGIEVHIYDPGGRTAAALRTLGIRTHPVGSLNSMPDSGVFVIGEGAFDGTRLPDKAQVEAFLARGGRIVCLRQYREHWDSTWLPATFGCHKERTYRPVTYIHPVGGNPILFDGLRERDLRYWNETGRTSGGTPEICPVRVPLTPASVSDLENVRIWASCGQMLKGIAIAEVFSGRGSVILNQFQCVERVYDDPLAAKLLTNVVRYAASSDHPARVDLSRSIRWDLEAFRVGAFASWVQGFLPHSKTYQHRGTSKGMLGSDHSIDGVTLVGKYAHNPNGWIDPVPDPNQEGWGIVYGSLSRSASRLTVELENTSDQPAHIGVKLDDRSVGERATILPHERKRIEWQIDRKPGPVKLELRGDQDLVIYRTSFE